MQIHTVQEILVETENFLVQGTLEIEHSILLCRNIARSEPCDSSPVSVPILHAVFVKIKLLQLRV
jgi:hypothetical protein